MSKQKSRTNKYKLLIFFVLCINIVVLTITIINSKDDKTSNSYSDKLYYDIQLKNILNSYSQSFQFNEEKLELSNKLVDTLKKIVLNKKLILRFSEYTCTTCIDNALEELEKIKNIIKDSNIVVISSFSSIKDYKNYKNRFQANYNLLNEFRGLTEHEGLKDMINPHFFLLDKDLKISSFYLYQEDLEHFNKDYFNLTVSKLIKEGL